MLKRSIRCLSIVALTVANLLSLSLFGAAHAEDTDIFTVNPNITSLRPNVLIIQDNSANWNTPFTAEKAALVSTVNGLDSRFNVGLMSFVETGGGNTNVDGSYMRAAVRQMTPTNKAALSGLVNSFDILADKSNNAVYGLTMAEVYRYFGGLNATTGQIKRDAAGNSVSGFTSAAASNTVFGLPGNAFTSMASHTYVSPIADNCAKNFVIFISNGPANDNNSATNTATSALQGYGGNITELSLSPNGSQGNVADEWARFLANSDVNATAPLTQNVYVYTVDVNPGLTGQGPGHTALLKSMALQGKGKYFAVTANSADIAAALNKIFQEVLAVNSVFASATLPVAANVRGSLLNQIYMGVFRPDGQALPRWTGNLKQFAAAPDSAGNLQLVDRNGDAVQNAATGFIKNNVTSFWTVGSSYWDASYYPDTQGIGGVSDAPDGDLVEKGGAAERLRNTYATSLTGRTLYTCLTSTCPAGTAFGASTNHSFSTLNSTLMALPATDFGISGIASVSGLTRSGTTATATTSAAHGFTTGQSVTISGADQTEYNGLFTATVTSTTQFTFTVVEGPTSPAAGTISLSRPATQFDVASLTRAATSSDAATGNSDTATAVTTVAHGLAVGAQVTISGAAQAEYNGGPFTVLTVPNATTFTYTVPVNPVTPATVAGTATVSGTAKTLASLTRVGKTVTGTTGAIHGFANSGSVTISGATPSQYNGTFAYTKTGNKTFTYTLANLATSTSATGTIKGSTGASPVTLASLTRSAGSTSAIGATVAAHGLVVGDTILISGATQTAYNGTFTVATVPTTKTFTYAVPVSPTSPATGTITASVTGTTSKSDLINWARGENRQTDDNPSTNSAANIYARGYLHGDVVHSRPAIINYNRAGQPVDRDIAVFYGSNDGIFHAVKGGQDDADGNELWGFVPSEFFSQLGRQYSASPVIDNSVSTTAKPYFADGPISTLLIDANTDHRIDQTTTGDKAYIYISMRRGGRFLYALDVTEAANPKLLWKLSNATAGMAELGQTWAEAKVAKIAGHANNVLILSAGYDAVANDATTQGTATMGRGVYIIDAITGEPLWFAGAPTAATAAAAAGLTSMSVSDMVYAIPGDATPIDSNGDGLVDRIYLADTGGNVWRANISAVTTGGLPDYANWSVSKLAELRGAGGASDARKFLFGPDVVPFDGPPTTKDSILIGSGDREQPFDVSITNRFYMIKDDHAIGATPSSTITESNLCDLTDDNLQGADADLKQASQDCIANDAKAGWYITMGTGEKVVTNAVTLNGATVFGTNVPESTLSSSSSNTCSSGLGEARLYTVSFKDATSLIDRQADGLLGLGDRYLVNKGGGFTPSPTAISITVGGKTYEGIGSGTTIIPPPGGKVGRRTRVFWNIHNEVE
jgi:type IV pilus assembly protein PilY1